VIGARQLFEAHLISVTPRGRKPLPPGHFLNLANAFVALWRDLTRALLANERMPAIFDILDDFFGAADAVEKGKFDRMEVATAIREAVHITLERAGTDPSRRAWLDAAGAGMTFFLESTAADRAGRGRASQSLSRFKDAIKFTEVRQEEPDPFLEAFSAKATPLRRGRRGKPRITD
jgi:hypothetical protein